MDAKALGERIHTIRIDNGMTMNEFMNMIDDQPPKNSSGVVNNWEHGRNMPNKRRLATIASLIDTSVSRLLSEKPIDTMMGDHDWGIKGCPGPLGDDSLSKNKLVEGHHISK